MRSILGYYFLLLGLRSTQQSLAPHQLSTTSSQVPRPQLSPLVNHHLHQIHHTKDIVSHIFKRQESRSPPPSSFFHLFILLRRQPYLHHHLTLSLLHSPSSHLALQSINHHPLFVDHHRSSATPLAALAIITFTASPSSSSCLLFVLVLATAAVCHPRLNQWPACEDQQHQTSSAVPSLFGKLQIQVGV